VVDPFQSRDAKAQQYGAFLMACYFIVYHHGGRIRATAGEHKGLSLSITLPIQPRPAAAADDAGGFLMRAMTNERLWERLLAGTY
jgi:K+-sensing histidine kinase KdpD